MTVHTSPRPPRRAPRLAVIIAARGAAATIGSAVASALADPMVEEVVVVDDASADGTAAAAARAAAGDDRLTVLVNPRNLGPAGSRNRALDASRAGAVALLDADDRFLPGRSAALLAGGWDLAADNVVFAADPDAPLPPGYALADARLDQVDLAAFVKGNLTRPGRSRGEMGFLKPIMSRAFLDRHGLRYDAALRLGEDYDLYVRALAAGARFGLSRRPGYLALLRPDSLSARHGSADLAALARAARAHLALPGLRADPAARAAARRLLHQVETRSAHRALLDRRREAGTVRALASLLARLDLLPDVAAAVIRDKLGRAAPAAPVPRLLLPLA